MNGLASAKVVRYRNSSPVEGFSTSLLSYWVMSRRGAMRHIWNVLEEVAEDGKH